MKLGFLGCGTIASAVVRGVHGQGHEIVVSERGSAHSSALAAELGVRVAPNQEVVSSAEVVFLGSTAEVAPDMLDGLVFRADQRVVSFMVGISLDALVPLVAPARVEALMIPFPNIAQGGSAVLCTPKSPLLEALFEPANTLYPLPDEAGLASYLAAQAVLSPVVKQVAEAATWLGTQSGDPQQGEAFLRHLVGANLSAAPFGQSGVLDQILADLNTPGGLNAQLREHMAEFGAYDALHQGLDILHGRLREV